jgi:hypothetical protein
METPDQKIPKRIVRPKRPTGKDKIIEGLDEHSLKNIAIPIRRSKKLPKPRRISFIEQDALENGRIISPLYDPEDFSDSTTDLTPIPSPSTIPRPRPGRVKPILNLKNLTPKRRTFVKPPVAIKKNVEEKLQTDELGVVRRIVKFTNSRSFPPSVSESRSKLNLVRCEDIPTTYYFRRSGLVFYSRGENDLEFYFNIFAGTDMGKTITAEISDFAGRVNPKESFIRGATMEALEESLGVFNFVGKEDTIAKVSHAVYSEDRSTVMIFCPIVIPSTNKYSIPTIFGFMKDKIESSGVFTHKELELKINGFERPTIDSGKIRHRLQKLPKASRKNTFNPDESIAIVHMNSRELISLIDDQEVEMSQKLADETGLDFEHFPILYRVIKRMMKDTKVIEVLTSPYKTN